MRSPAKRTRKVGFSPLPRFNPLMSLEEGWIIETASRMRGQDPVEFMREAGLALALRILDGAGGTSGTGGTGVTRLK
jgi:hypothetical protein